MLNKHFSPSTYCIFAIKISFFIEYVKTQNFYKPSYLECGTFATQKEQYILKRQTIEYDMFATLKQQI